MFSDKCANVPHASINLQALNFSKNKPSILKSTHQKSKKKAIMQSPSSGPMATEAASTLTKD